MKAKPSNILYVDDEMAILQMMSISMKSLGHTIVPVEDPRSALAVFVCDPFEFDLVVTHTTMSGMDGGRLLKEMLRIRPDTPGILCTGSAEMTDKEARALGFRAMIQKPVRPDELIITVNRVLLQSEGTYGAPMAAN